MDLEEAINELKSLSPSETAIKTVLQELDKEKYFNKIHGYHMKCNFIPKKKIKNKIKECKKIIQESIYKDSIYCDEIKAKIQVLQELLEDK